MNHQPPVQPVEFCLRRLLTDIQTFTQREPVQAVAAAIGVGILINLLPTRALVGTVTVVGATLVRPLLLSLGVTKAMELCCQKTPPNAPHESAS